MKNVYYPVHLYLGNVRKKQHAAGPYLGKAFVVPRGAEKGVRVRLYRPAKDSERTLPVLFNVHGGAWLFGDAEGVDLQSQYLANHLDCFVVNIDYRMLDEEPFPYQQTTASSGETSVIPYQIIMYEDGSNPANTTVFIMCFTARFPRCSASGPATSN